LNGPEEKGRGRGEEDGDLRARRTIWKAGTPPEEEERREEKKKEIPPIGIILLIASVGQERQ